MFKKMFVTCLALMLALSIGLQATPVLAQGNSTAPALESQEVWAEIKYVSLLNGFPPRIRIDGTLPAGCYNLNVSQPIIGKPTSNNSITPITLLVRGVWQSTGTMCTPMPKFFSTTVTLDPFDFDLAPGYYLVRVNPQLGQSPNQILITIPPRLD